MIFLMILKNILENTVFWLTVYTKIEFKAIAFAIMKL